LYPEACLEEGTNFSEGGGTTKLNEWIRLPYIDGQKVANAFNQRKIRDMLARPTSFIPTYQKHEAKACQGIQLPVVDRYHLHSLEVGLYMLEVIADMYPKSFQFLKNENDRYFFDLLAGTKRLKRYIIEGRSSDFLKECKDHLRSFNTLKEPYLLYK